MLSLKHILKAWRLLDQAGATISTDKTHSPSTGEARSVKISLDYEVDGKTGDVRIVQR